MRHFVCIAVIATLGIASMPIASALAYSCEVYGPLAVCAGSDDAPDCPTGNERSDWGFDVYIPTGLYAGFGGSKWCTTGDGTRENQTMDAGVYRGSTYAAVTFVQTKHTPEESAETQTECTTTVRVGVNSARHAPAMPCPVPPPNPSDPLLPEILP